MVGRRGCLGHYSRDRGILTLEEAVNRVTQRPAQRLGLKDRGLLRAGYFADVVVFNPSLVADGATFLEPRVHPDGFEHVFVNGLAAVAHGQRTATRSGRVLRRA